jgi:ABC-type multidrug transport system fused ATPase/permease subunit
MTHEWTSTANDVSACAAADGALPHPLRRGLAPFARRHRGSLGRGLLFTMLLVTCRLALPLPLGALVAHSTTASAPPQDLAHVPAWVDPVTMLAAGFVSLALVAGMAEYFQRLAFANFANRSVNDARSAASARVSSLDAQVPVDLAAQLLADSARVKQGLKGVLNHIALNVLLVIGACAALAVADPQLGAVQLAGVALVVVVAVRSAKRVRSVAADHREGEARLAQVIQHFAATDPSDLNVSDVHALQCLDAASGSADIDMTRWEGRCTWAAHAILTAISAAVLILGLRAAEAGRLDTGVLFTVVGYVLVVHGPAVRLARQTVRLGVVLVSAEHLGRVLVQPANKPPPERVQVRVADGGPTHGAAARTPNSDSRP